MLRLTCNVRVRCPWSLNQIRKIVRQVVEAEKKLCGLVEINIIGEEEMRYLNSKYRGGKGVTDVLSFAWREDKIVKTANLGQIYLCWAQIEQQAEEIGENPREEFVRVLTHGLLHLVGYDHQTKEKARLMFGFQEKLVRKIYPN